MHLPDAVKKLGEFFGEHLERNICDSTKEHADKFVHMLPDWLGNEDTKKEAIDVLEEISKDLVCQLFKQYLKIDLKKYFD